MTAWENYGHITGLLSFKNNPTLLLLVTVEVR